MSLDLFKAIEVEKRDVLEACMEVLDVGERLVLLRYALHRYSEKHAMHDQALMFEAGSDQGYIRFVYQNIKKYEKEIRSSKHAKTEQGHKRSKVGDANDHERMFRWKKGQSAFLEVFYSMLLAEAIACEKKELFLMQMAMYCNVTLKDPFQKLHNMKKRKYDNQTPLLDEMKKLMSEYLEKV